MNDIQHQLEQALPIQAVLIRSCFLCPCRNTEWNDCDMYEELYEPKKLNVSAFSGHATKVRHPDCPLNISRIILLGV